MNLFSKEIFAALPSVLGAAAIAPSLLILWTIASMDRRAEPTRVVVATFLLGAAGASLLSYVPFFVPGISKLTDWPILQIYVHTTFDIAAPEEALKLSVLILFSSRYIAFNHPMEGAVYGAAAGLGFAAYENLFYLANNPDYWATLAIVRGLLTVPVHGALGIIIGIYVGRAKFGNAFGRRRGYRFRLRSYVTGWAIAAVLHGFFDFPLMLQQQPGLYQSDQNILLLASGIAVAGVATGIAARIIYSVSRSHATSPNSFTTGGRFQNHSWHLTGLLGVILFLIALPLLGWARHMYS